MSWWAQLPTARLRISPARRRFCALHVRVHNVAQISSSIPLARDGVMDTSGVGADWDRCFAASTKDIRCNQCHRAEATDPVNSSGRVGKESPECGRGCVDHAVFILANSRLGCLFIFWRCWRANRHPYGERQTLGTPREHCILSQPRFGEAAGGGVKPCTYNICSCLHKTLPSRMLSSAASLRASVVPEWVVIQTP